MKIDKAIEYLQRKKANGQSHILIAWWDKEDVESNTNQKFTDEQWAQTADWLEDKLDWSPMNESMDILLNQDEEE